MYCITSLGLRPIRASISIACSVCRLAPIETRGAFTHFSSLHARFLQHVLFVRWRAPTANPCRTASEGSPSPVRSCMTRPKYRGFFRRHKLQVRSGHFQNPARSFVLRRSVDLPKHCCAKVSDHFAVRLGVMMCASSPLSCTPLCDAYMLIFCVHDNTDRYTYLLKIVYRFKIVEIRWIMILLWRMTTGFVRRYSMPCPYGHFCM